MPQPIIARPRRCPAAVVLIVLCAPWISAAPLQPGYQLNAERNSATPIDPAVLQHIAEETRLSFAAAGNAADSPAFHDVHALRARLGSGDVTRDQFLKSAPELINKRRRELQQSGKGNLASRQGAAATPDQQARLFLALLSDAVAEMHLPPSMNTASSFLSDKANGLHGESARRTRDGRDGEWLSEYQSATTAELLKRLPRGQQEDLVRAWPTLFPDGPAAPTLPEVQQSQTNQPNQSHSSGHTSKPEPQPQQQRRKQKSH
jgi:hypothetical protein